MKTTLIPELTDLESVAPCWRWHARTLLALRQRLHEELGEQRPMAAIVSQSHTADEAAAAADEAEREVLFSSLSVEVNMLVEIEAALERLQQGSYGICEDTGRPIPPARLRAVPWTRFTREAAARCEENR